VAPSWHLEEPYTTPCYPTLPYYTHNDLSIASQTLSIWITDIVLTGLQQGTLCLTDRGRLLITYCTVEQCASSVYFVNIIDPNLKRVHESLNIEEFFYFVLCFRCRIHMLISEVHRTIRIILLLADNAI
jgi:hypothetical protein